MAEKHSNAPLAESQETWKAIPEYEGTYEVSDTGIVRTVKQPRRYVSQPSGKVRTRKGKLQTIRTLSVCGEYPMVCLFKDKKRQTIAVHRVMCLAFYGPYPPGHVTNHINGDKHDNRLENLEVVTSSENANHARRTGLMKPNRGPLDKHIFTPEQIEEIRSTCKVGDRSGLSIKGLAAKFGVTRHTIRRLLIRLATR